MYFFKRCTMVYAGVAVTLFVMSLKMSVVNHATHTIDVTNVFVTHNNTFERRLPYGLKGEESRIRQLLEKIPTHIPNFLLYDKRCIVVGNSYNLHNRSLGRIIDSYDVVIRLNDAPTRAFERDVGTRTTIRMFYPESAQSNPVNENTNTTLFVMVPFKSDDLYWLYNVIANNARISLSNFWKKPPRVWSVRPSFVRVLHPKYTYEAALRIQSVSGSLRVPTMGMITLVTALHMCRGVTITGFGYPNGTPTQFIHYYNGYTMNDMKNSIHDVGTEKTIIERMIRNRTILHIH
ncbi:m138L [Myxoma virus]|uniref:Alpha(2,3)-sialyltransferase n=2 Tax=Myxoma virus TaxID=10273 RepID=Q9YN04_9POXV|nr:alpha(2,3)-sialyltransferase [Myxoma virus]ADK63778.1 m138L [Myxoma virus]AGU99820.1 m138L [Myxoma virus]